MAVASVDIQVDARSALQQLKAVNQQSQQLQATTNGTTQALGRQQQVLNSARSGISGLASGIAKLTAAYVGLRTAQEAVQAGIQREESSRRLQFLAKGYGEIAAAQDAAARAGRQFGLSTTESNQQFAQLYGRLRPLGVSIQDVETAFVGFNTAAKVSGATAAESAGALLQLTQALGSGVLRGQELNSVLEQAPGLVVALTQELGAPISQIRKLAEEGKITTEVVIRALKRAGTEGADELAEAMKGPAQQIKNLQNAFEDFQVQLSKDVIPAIISIVQATTELLKVFGQLPGPLKTLILAVTGLVAAFAALAPVVATVKGLLGAISIGGLIAAGPWIALAAGITAATIALAGYRSEAQKVAGAAKTGTVADVVAARNLSVQKGQEISLLEQQRKTVSGQKRASIDRRLRVLRGEQAELQSAITASTADRPAAAALPPAVTGGGSKAAKDAERAADAAAKEAERVAEIIRLRTAEGQVIRLKSELQDRISVAEQAGDEQLVLRLQSQQREIDLQYKYAQELAKETDTNAQKAIIFEAQNALIANQADLQRQLNEAANQSARDQIAALEALIGKNYELTEQQKMQQALAENIAGTVGQNMTSAFDALIQGSEDFGASLKNIASGVLIDIARQLLQIYVINQAISAISGLFGPKAGGTPTYAGVTGNPLGTSIISGNFTAVPFSTAGLGYKAMGGSVTAGKPYVVGEKGPELFMPGKSGGIAPAGTFGGANVVVNVDASGSNVQGDQGQAKALGAVIGAAVQAELIKQKKPGGLLY